MQEKLRWWEWGGLACLVFLLVQRLVRLWLHGFAVTPAWQAALFALLLALWAWARWHEARELAAKVRDHSAMKVVKEALKDQKPLVSIVMLLREPRYLDEKILAHAAGKAWGINLDSDDDDPGYFVVGEERMFVIQGPGAVLGVLNIDAPYADDPASAARTIPELRRRRAVENHKAWCAVDVLATESGRREDAYPTVGKLIAQLADEDCLALVAPETNAIVPYDAELDAALNSDKPLDAFGLGPHVPVIPVDENDPQMEAAAAEARRRWPEFVAAFAERQPDQMFSVKAPLRDGDACEFIWVRVTSIKDDMIHGELGNQPVDLTNCREGDAVQVPVAELNDWLYVGGDGNPVGGFTVRVLCERHGQRQRG
jgi:uncharacterized protein YegJ (DUF2314 family)